MKKVSFSISSAKPQAKPEHVSTSDESQNDSNRTKHLITEFDPSKPPTPSSPKTLIPPIHNQWKPLNPRTQPHNDDDAAAAPWRRTPAETELLRKLKLQDDLQRLPEHQGLEEFEAIPVAGFGAALLAGYGWREGMGIGKNAKEDVKVAQIKRRTAGEGLGFVRDAPILTNNANFNHCSFDLRHFQM